MKGKFGEQLLDRHVTIIFGNGVYALGGAVIAVHDDYLEVRQEALYDDGPTVLRLIHVPLSSIVYVKLGKKVDIG